MIVYLLEKHVIYPGHDEASIPVGIYDDIIKGKYSNGDVGRWYGNNIEGYYTKETKTGTKSYSYMMYYTLTAYPLNNEV